MGVCFSKEYHSKAPKIAKEISHSEISSAIAYIHNLFKFEKVLGHGHFGTVRRACRKDNLSHKYAIKSIPKKQLAKDIKFLRRELDTLRQVDHPNVIQLYEVFEDEKYLHLVMELCTGGDLFDNLIDKGQFSEKKAAKIMMKVMAAVNHMHSISICHRDIKPENFLLTSKRKDAEIKIVDFGLSNKFREKERGLHSVVGTPYYVAPEVLRKNYSKECDIWSLGVVLYVLLAGQPPFKGSNHRSIFQKIIKCEYSFESSTWESVSDSAKDLIRKMLVVKPHKRITIDQALRHPWFKLHFPDNLHKLPLNVLNSLKNLHNLNRFEEVAIRFIIKHLNISDIFELNDAFRALDTHSRGFITSQELQETLQRFQVAEDHKQKLLNSVNIHSDGRIYYTDFLIATLNRKKLFNEERIHTAFKFFDVDNSGYITLDDLNTAMIRAGCPQSKDQLLIMLKELKYIQNNKIAYQDFKKIVMNAVPTAYSPLKICNVNKTHAEGQHIM